MTVRRRLRAALYRLYLVLPWWRFIRQWAIARAGHRCERCGDTRRIQVHHVRYRRDGHSVLWRERMEDLAVLCRRCHRESHAR